MTGASSLLRTLVIYSVCLPLAIFLGYLMATPLDFTTLFGVGLILFILCLPLLLRAHHMLLIVSINMFAVVPFIPGKPYLWIAATWLSLTISLGQYILNRRLRFISVPSVTKPLIFLSVVVLITMKLTGGFGLATFGGNSMGGKRYVMLLSAVLAYFAFTGQQIHPRRARLAVSLFFLGAATSAVGELAPLLPSGAYIIFALFPVSQFGYDAVVSGGGISALGSRLSGLAGACSAIVWAMLAHFGIGQIFTVRNIGRALIFVGLVFISLMGGFRSAFIFFGMTFCLLFYLEGLIRSKLLPILLLFMVLGGALSVGFVDRLPFSMQRALSFLPLNVDPAAREGAEGSTEWRLKMWRDVIPDIPKYLILGKGYAISAAELSATQVTVNEKDVLAGTELAGDYHSGPLSVLLTFGIFGTVGLIWFMAASWRVMYHNYKFGPPEYGLLNRFLYAFFVVKVITYFFIFGSLYTDMIAFTGLVGLSVSLNGGVARKPLPVPQLQQRPQPARFQRPRTVAAI